MNKGKYIISDELIPFNEAQEMSNGTEFADCFYSCLFTFLKTHKKDINSYIANIIFTYNNLTNEEDLRVKYGIQENLGQPLEELYEQSNIRVIYVPETDLNNIITVLVRYIDGNMPCCVLIDMFYLPFRKDRYHKIHSVHYIFIYGVDLDQGKLYIIDNPQNDYYYKVEMSILDFLSAYEGTLENFGTEILSFSNGEGLEVEYSEEYFKDKLINNYILYKKDIYNGLNGLKNLEKEFKDITSDKKIWESRSTNLFYLIHYHIFNKKRSECYALFRILHDDILVERVKDIINDWSKIRDICYYFDISKKYKYQMVKNAQNNLLQVIMKEEKFYDELYKTILVL